MTLIRTHNFPCNSSYYLKKKRIIGFNGYRVEFTTFVLQRYKAYSYERSGRSISAIRKDPEKLDYSICAPQIRYSKVFYIRSSMKLLTGTNCFVSLAMGMERPTLLRQSV